MSAPKTKKRAPKKKDAPSPPAPTPTQPPCAGEQQQGKEGTAGPAMFSVPRARDAFDTFAASSLRIPEVVDHEWPSGFAVWQYKFLNALAFRPNIVFAAGRAGISFVIQQKYRAESEEFGKAVLQAIEFGWDRVEQAAHSRAVDGVEKLKFGKDGVVVGVEVEYSDSLAALLLKGHRPERYKDNAPKQEDTTGSLDAAVGRAVIGGAMAALAAKLIRRGVLELPAE